MTQVFAKWHIARALAFYMSSTNWKSVWETLVTPSKIKHVKAQTKKHLTGGKEKPELKTS